MKTIYLDIIASMIKTTKTSSSTLLWYDVKQKRMNKYQGSHLNLKYDFVGKKMNVVPQDGKMVGYEKVNNKLQIQEWIQANNDVVVLNDEYSSITQIAIDVADDKYDDVCDMLYSAGIRYS